MSETLLVLDTSALVAAIKGELGGDVVYRYMTEIFVGNVHMHAVNTCEVAYHIIKTAIVDNMAYKLASPVTVNICDVIKPSLWQRAASLKANYKHFALGDCICVAFAESLDATILTGDRHFKDVDTPVKVELFR